MTTTIDAIRQREQAADPGPWTAHPDGLVWSQLIGDPVSGSVELANAEFIAHARTDVPALLAKVDELTAELEKARAVVEAAKTWRRHYGNTSEAFGAACTALAAAADALPETGATR